ncbi:uncharacterized protein E0L32_006148 [Thyridium curvatum]|uniref:Uncharacterized protein n=1 Tax=Thyridium curvatum TaxID=1093900 RepID=A0A507B9H0_9PEZI|nr:uncharacterized protein E0L32_006148 [Thyridium curvatum]TPX13418.1 hypothetical protein E0L32_006148 [Thyridium curvatum]
MIMAGPSGSTEERHHLPTTLAQSMARLDQLPNELLYLIAEYLDLGSLDRLAQSKRAFYGGFMPLVYNKSAIEHKNILLFWAAEIGNLDLLEEALAAQGHARDVNIYGTSVRPWKEFATKTVPKWDPSSTHAGDWPSSSVFQTPLHLAVVSGHPEVVDKLLDYGADINAPSQMTCTCLARREQYITGAQYGRLYAGNLPLIDDHSPMPVWAPLHLAICHNQLSVARLLLQRGASLLASPEQGVSAVQSAAGHGNADMITLIAQYGGLEYVNDRCQSLSPPILWALEALELKEEPTHLVIEALLKLGANINHRGGRWYTTPLAVACMTGQFKVAAYLMDMGASLSSCTLTLLPGATLLHMCLDRDRNIEKLAGREYNPLNMLSKLVKAGLDLEARVEITGHQSATQHTHTCCSWHGWTPLWGACQSGDLRVVELMLQLGAKADIQRSNGGQATLLDCQFYCHFHPRLDIVNALLGAGARLGNTTISHTSILKNPPLLKVLVKSGISVNTVTRNGMTPLQIAISRSLDGRPERISEGIPSESVALLLDGGAAVDVRTGEGLGVMGNLLQRGIVRNEKMYSLAGMLVSRGAPLYDPKPVYLNDKLCLDSLTRIVMDSINRRYRWARHSKSYRQNKEYTDPLLEKILQLSVKECFTKECLEKNIKLCCHAEADDIAEWLGKTMTRHGLGRPGLRPRTKRVKYTN